MFAANKTGVTSTPAVTTDPYFNYTTLLLNDTGTNGAQNNTFVDSSTNNFSITRTGNTTQGSFNPYEPTGYWGGYFDGTGDYLTVATNAAFTYATGDFTIEGWAQLNKVGSIQYLVDQRNSGTASAIIPSLYVSASNVLTYYVSGAAQITGTTAIPNGSWFHFAVCRSGTSTKLFLNGVQEGSTYSDSNNYAASRVVLGSQADTASNYLQGYLSNIRLVKGSAVYTANFTVPTTPLTAITNTSLLCLQDNRFKDNSSNNFTLTRSGDVAVTGFNPFAPTASYTTSAYGGSAYFDGSGDYLTSSSVISAGTGDFTVEAWIYSTSTADQNISTRFTGNNQFRINLTTVGSISLIVNGSVTINAVGTAVIRNVWNHVAAVREGTTCRVYVNGIQQGTGTSSSTFALDVIGGYVSAGLQQPFNGYITDFRFLVGTCLYPSGTTFTPPTAPLTAITNTSLLLKATNAGIYDATALNDMETVGNAQVSTTQAKWGASSISTVNTSSGIITPASFNHAFGTGNFTLEAWVYFTTIGSYNAIFDISSGGGTPTNQIVLDFRVGSSTSNLFVYINGSSASGTTVIQPNTWYHVAATRSGTTVRGFLNGTQELSFTSSANISTSNYVGIGKYVAGPTNGICYMEDVRITKGIARYTANFTAPTAAFPTR